MCPRFFSLSNVCLFHQTPGLVNFCAMNRNMTQLPKKPRRLKKALREYIFSSSSVRNEVNTLLMLATIMRIARFEPPIKPLHQIFTWKKLQKLNP